ncbi:poly(hydroxyalkanoate) granule-associated protein [Rhizobium leguminosarum]|uniref:Poly(Hydroxyalkanoate) granule-associated protein n=1 Tax=Rhizobium leguminosarum TaxID=384 RepID=A0A4Q1UEC2_RHILE|nr:poly(hydroxyalkanoate) granule-associated protein [Rhizobium leguminosarum]RXT29385.1 poly(hydroxyalkanoate) granule-associated protein [Rhizobium leguminosarum]
MIRYATSAASNPEPIKVREVSAAKPAIEMPPPKPVIEVVAAPDAAGLLLSSEADELGSDTRPKKTKPARRAATKRKSKAVEADDTSLQLSLDS